MKFILHRIQINTRLLGLTRTGLASKLAGLAFCMLGLYTNAADITVTGLDDAIKEEVRVAVQVDEPVQRVHMKVAGIVNQIDHDAPFSLMGDDKGKLNAWDTREHANGKYLLTVVATLEDGEEVTKHFPFSIENPLVKLETTDVSISLKKIPSQVHVGQSFTIPVSGIEDGEVVWYHVFDRSWRNPLRENLKVVDGSVTFSIPQTTEDRRLQLQYGSKYQTSRLIEVLPAVKLPEPETTEEATPTEEPAVAPEPEASPAEEPATGTDPDAISFGMASIPAELAVGQRVSVPAAGLADGEVVYFHLFDSNWGDVVRASVKVNGGAVELMIPQVSGDRILQLQYKNGFRDQKSVTVGVNVPVSEPEVAPEPVEESEPAGPMPSDEPTAEPQPTSISFDLASVPADLKVGQQVSVTVTGIADGETVYFHLFDKNWGDLVRSNIKVKAGKLELLIPDVTGERILHLQYKKNDQAKKNVKVGRDIPEPVQAPEVVPEPEVVAEPDAAPTQEPESTPEALPVSFGLASVPSDLTARQRVSVSVQGIAEGEVVFFHLFDSQWANLVRMNVTVQSGNVELIIPNVSGKRILQLQYGKSAKAHKNVVVTSSTTQSSSEAEDPTAVSPAPKPSPSDEPVDVAGPEPSSPQDADPEVVQDVPVSDDEPAATGNNGDGSTDQPAALPSGTQRIAPGNGWTGATPVPAQIGDRHEIAIAHWNVVPEQQVSDGFTVGVIAHHLDGVDRVEISANNGPWVSIGEASINPRTQCEEYWASLDLAGYNKKIELRAIVYPKKGKPVLVTPIGKTYGSQDMTLYPYKVGAVLELGAGEHTLSPRSLPETGWLIVRPKPGLSRDDVVLVGKSRDWKSGRLKVEGVTVRYPAGGGGFMGTADNPVHLWLDNCKLIGNGPKDLTWAVAFYWETLTCTNSEISQFGKVFFSAKGISNLVRNCRLDTIYEDAFNTGGLVVNVELRNMDREPAVAAGNLSKAETPHPDFSQTRVLKNTIFQDVTAVDNVNAQGLFIQSGYVESVAVVRMKIKVPHPWKAFAPEVPIKNWLIKDSNFDGGISFSRASVEPGERLMLLDSSFGRSAPYIFSGWDQPGVYVYPRPPLYD